jgi:large subunit ribosomal protein L24
MKLKVGDTVLVTTGKDKGREGKISQVLPRSERVVIEGINIYKRHLKPRGQSQPGQIVERARPLPVANVSLKCLRCRQQTRIGYQLNREGKKVRICRKCKSEIKSKKQ